MAINVQIYSNVNTSSKSIAFDFVGDVLAADNPGISPSNASAVEYYFKITTGARQDDNAVYPAKVARSLSELVLNSEKQRITDTANAYTNIKSMVVDYVYDYINGHTADQFSTGVLEQKRMKTY